MATGLQKKFSWAGVAAAGMGAYVGHQVGLNLPDSTTELGARVAVNAASGIAMAATRTLIEGSDFGDNLIASLPDIIGQTMGDAFARAISSGASDARGAKGRYSKELQLPELSEESKRELSRLLGEAEASTIPIKLIQFLGGAGRRSAAGFALWPGDTSGGVERIGVPEFEDDHLMLTRLKSEEPGRWSIVQSVNPWTLEPVDSNNLIKEYREIGIALDRGDGILVIQNPDGIAEMLGHPLNANIVVPVGADGDAILGFGVVVHDQDEMDLVDSLRNQGTNSNEINSQLALFRISRGTADAVRRPTTDEIRGWPGTAHVSGDSLPIIDGPWLFGHEGPIPGQVAARLEGRRFENWREFRREFWKVVADTPELAAQFNDGNRALMRDGNAPFAIPSQQHGDQQVFQIHHPHELQFGGPLYDMSNMRVVTPRRHNHIHHGRN